QWVERRAPVPRSAFTSTSGMRVASGNGFARIVREEVSSAQEAERDREKIDDAVDHLPRTLLLLALLGLVPATALVYGVYRFYGRELEGGYDRIRRGRYKAEGVTTERSTWAGMRSEQLADLELTRGDDEELTEYEQAV